MNMVNIVYAVFMIIVLCYMMETIEGFYYFNMPTRSTRNMSYDLRGDISPIHQYVGPWNMSPFVWY